MRVPSGFAVVGVLLTVEAADLAELAGPEVHRSLSLASSHALMRMTYFDLQDRPEFIGAWQAGQAFVAEAWTDVLGEVRGEGLSL